MPKNHMSYPNVSKNYYKVLLAKPLHNIFKSNCIIKLFYSVLNIFHWIS